MMSSYPISLWDELKNESRPVVLYGTGNGADKILNELEKRAIPVQGVFASDGFVRDRSFRGFHVESLQNLVERLGDDLLILVAFGSSLPTVMEQIDRLAETYDVRLPEVPLFGEDLFDTAYFETHREKIEAARALLTDETSKALFEDMLLYRLTGKPAYLKNTCPFREMLSLFDPSKISFALDGGAFTGDTASEMAAMFPNLKRLVAVEPDPRSFKKLSDQGKELSSITPVNCILGSDSKTIAYHSAGSRASAIQSPTHRAKEISMPVETVDRLCQGQKLDLLKLDVEGAEKEALQGAVSTLRKDCPDLLVSLYHRTSDLFELPLWLHETVPAYRFRLRRVSCYPAWDLTLLATID